MRKFLLLFLGVFGFLCSLNADIRYAWGPIDFEDGKFPSGWTQETVLGSTSWTVEGGKDTPLTNPDGAHSGSYRIAARCSEEHIVTRLISPTVDITDMVSPQLCFYHAQVNVFDHCDTLRVYYRINDQTKWELLREYAGRFPAWTSEVIDLRNYMLGKAYQVAFEIASNAGKGVVLDDISILQPSSCQPPEFQTIQPSAHTAEMELVSGGTGYGSTGDFFDLVVSVTPLNDPASAVEGEGVFVYNALKENLVSVKGLSANTTYHAYLRTNCADNASGYTEWTSATFQTTILKSLPYDEDFSATVGNSDYATLPGWTFNSEIKGAYVPYVYVGSSSYYREMFSVDTTAYLAFVASQSTNLSEIAIPAGKYVYAASPEIDGDLSKCEVSFWGTANNYIYDGGPKTTDHAAELTVGVMDDPADYSTFTPIKTVRVESAYQFKHFFVSLRSYTGKGKYVALCSKVSKQNAFFVDNFRVALAPTPTPMDIRISNLAPKGMDISAELFGADSWNIKVSEQYVRDAASLSDSQCLLSKTGITGASYSYSVTDESLADKILLIYVQAVKAGEPSEWSFPVTVRVPKNAKLPLQYTFNTDTYTSIPLQQLNNELHPVTKIEALGDVYFPLTGFYYRYPTVSMNAPMHEGGHMELRGLDNYIVFPYTERPKSLEVQFYLSVGEQSTSNVGTSRVAVGVMTDPYDLSTFVELARFDGGDSTYVQCVADLYEYDGVGHYVAIRAIEPASPHPSYISYNALDDVLLHKAPTCKTPTNVQSTTGVTAVALSWDANTMTKWFVSLYSDAQLKNLIKTQTVTTPSATFSDLASQTTYYYTIRTICDIDTTTANRPYSFTTKCGIPFREKFVTPSLPVGWSILKGKLSSVWKGTPPMPVSEKWNIGTISRVATDGNAAYIQIYGEYTYHWLVMPDLLLETEKTSARLTFDAALVTYNSGGSIADRNKGIDDQFAVVISTDGGVTWKRENTIVWNNAKNDKDYILNDLPQTMQRISIDLSSYIGQFVRVAFYAESTETNADNYLVIDNVNINTYDKNCLGITSLLVKSSDEYSASVDWKVSGNQSVHLDVYEQGKTTSIFSGNVTDNPYLLKGLTENTQYTIVAHQTCNTEDTLTTTFRTLCIPHTPAELGMFDFSDQDALSCWITGIYETTGVGSTPLSAPSIKSQTGFGNVLYLNKPKNTATEKYGNTYYATMPALDIDSIAKYQVTFNAAVTTIADTANVGKLYVGVVTKPTDLSTLEVMDTLYVQYAQDSLSMSSYSIGFDRYTGDYLGKYGKYVTFLVEAPENYSDEIIVDNVLIEPVSSCRQVTNMRATDITVSSATLRWTGEATDYRVVVTTMPCNPDTVSSFVFDQVVSNTYIALTDLQNSTTYYAYNKAVCGTGDSARWSNMVRFSTAYSVPYLENFAPETITSGEWLSYNQSFDGDTLDVSALGSTTTGGRGWKSLSVPTGIVGINGYAAGVEVYRDYDALLVSPLIWLPNSDKQLILDFKAARSKWSFSGSSSVEEPEETTSQAFSVLISKDGKIWTRANGVKWASDGTGDYNYNDLTLQAQHCKINLSAYAGEKVYLGFFVEALGQDCYLFVDSVSISLSEFMCNGVTKLAVLADSLTTHSVALQVSSFNNTDTIEYVYGVGELDFATLKPVHADFSAIRLSGLQPSTTYTFAARTLCATGDTSAWSKPIYFTTKCLVSVPVTYHFDEAGNRYNIADTKYQMENCFDVAFSNTSCVPYIENNTSTETYSYSGTSALYMTMPAASHSSEYVVVALPAVDADLDSLRLSFMARAGYASASSMHNATGDYLHSVLVGTMDNLSDRTTFRLIKEVALEPLSKSAVPSADEKQFWRQQVVSLEGAKGNIVFMQRRGSKTNYIWIDDVMLSKRPDCTPVENLRVDNISTTSAIVRWNSENTNFCITLQTGTTKRIFDVSDTHFRLTDLTPNTSYTVSVATVCGTDTTPALQKDFITPNGLPFYETFSIAFPATWSQMRGKILDGKKLEAASAEWVHTTTNIYGINAPKMMWELSRGKSAFPAGYQYSEQNSILVTPLVMLDADGTYPITLSFDMALTAAKDAAASPIPASMKERKFAILVSEDNATTWTKIDSLIWATDDTSKRRFDSIPATSTHYSFDFSAYRGKSIRVAFYAYSPANAASGCLHFTNVELKEDNPSCVAPANLRISDVTPHDATIAWSGSPAERYQVQVATDASFQMVYVDTICTDTIMSLHTLRSNTLQYVRVRMLCSDKAYTHWIESTCLTIADLPFVEEFNTITTAFPVSWTRYEKLWLSTLLGNTNPLNTASIATTGWEYSKDYNKCALADENHVSIEISSYPTNQWMISPQIDLTSVATGANILFSFDAALTTGYAASAPGATKDQKFYVAVSEDGGTTWNKENLITWSDAAADLAQYRMSEIPAGEGQNYRFIFSKYAGKSIRIAFGVNASSFVVNRLHIDNIRLEEVSSLCFGISKIEVDSISATLAKLHLISDDSALQWQYMYGISGFKSDTAKCYSTDTKIITLSDLRPDALYDVCVRSVCAAGDTSAWSKPFTFHTSYALPFEEMFDSIATKYPAYWNRYKEVTLQTLFTSTNPFASANKEIAQWGSDRSNRNALSDENHVSVKISTGSGSNRWLVSPSIDLSAVSADTYLSFSFDAALTDGSISGSPRSSDGQSFYLIVSEDNGRTWQKQNLIIWSNTPADGVRYKLSDIPAGEGKNYALDFSKYIGKQIQVALGVYATANETRLHIDNVRLEETAAACASVFGVKTDTLGATRAVLSFSVEGKETQWQYAYGVSGFALTETTPITIDTTSFVLSDLSPHTQYDIYLRTICSETSMSDWVKYTFKTAYILPLEEDFARVDTSFPADWLRYSAVYPDDLFAGNKNFASLSAVSFGWNYSATDGAYAMEDNKHLTVNLSDASKSAYWIVSPLVDMTQTTDSLNILLTFDLALTNQDDVYAPSSTENFQFHVLVSADGGKTWEQQNAVLWSDAISDNAYSPLSVIRNGDGSACLLNLTQHVGKMVQIAFGATSKMSLSEDKMNLRYHLDNIRLYADSSYCFEPKTIEQISSTSSSLSLRIQEANKKTNQWQYAYAKRGSEPADTVPVNMPTFTISDLLPGTHYDVYARSICSATDTSAWVGPYTFATSCTLPYLEEFTSIKAEFPLLWTRYRSLSVADILSGKVSFQSEKPATTGWGYNAYNTNALADVAHVSVEINSIFSCSWLVSPTIELPDVSNEDKLAFSFDAALTQWATNKSPESVATQRFYVLVSEDAGRTWSKQNTLLWSDLASDSANYYLSDILANSGTHYLFDFTAYAGKTIRLAFGVEASARDNHLHLDNISLCVTKSVCASVSRPIKTDASATSLALRISEDNQAISWQYAYGASGFIFDATAQYYTTISRDILLLGLSANTSYDVYLRAVCAAGDTSAWAGPFAYRTDYRIPFVETFDKMASTNSPANWMRYINIQASAILSGDTLLSKAMPYVVTGTCDYWGYNYLCNKNAFSDENHISVKLDKTSANQAVMLTPVIDLSAETAVANLLFSFEAALTNEGSATAPASTAGQRFYVMVSDDAGKTWNRANAILWSDLASDAADFTMSSIPVGNGKTYRFDFSKYIGKKIQIAFAVESSVSSARLHIDNVKLEIASTTCYGVSNIKLQTATASSLSFTFVPEDKATQWQYAVCQSGTPLTDATPRYPATNTQITVSALTAHTAYDIYVRSICAEGDTSAWSVPYTMTTCFAAPYEEPFDNISSAFPQNWTTYRNVFSLSELLSGAESFAAKEAFIPTNDYTTSTYWGYNSLYNGNALADKEHIGIELCAASSQSWLLSPVVDMTDADAMIKWELSFEAAMTEWGKEQAPLSTNDQLFCIAISEDGGVTFKDAIVWNNDSTRRPQYALSDIPVGKGKLYAFDFSKYVGKKVRVAFGIEATKNDNHLHVDNISILPLNQYTYKGTICSSSDYQDSYFTIRQADLQIGETEYTRQIVGQNNAPDTVVTLVLTVLPSVNVELYDTICQGAHYNRYGFDVVAQRSTVLAKNMTATNGCDSLVQLHLEVLPTIYNDTIIMACLSYDYYGTTYYTNQFFTDTLTSATGCDSIVTTSIRISSKGATETLWRTTFCAGDTYTDELFTNITKPGIYTASTNDIYGCDSTVTLLLMEADATKKVVYDTISQAELPYMFEGTIFLGEDIGAGDYEHDIQSSCGQITLYMHVYKETGLSSVEVGTLLLNPNPARVGEPIRIVSKFSSYDRYSVSVLSALGQTVFHSDTPVEYLPGMSQAGVYTVRVATDTQMYQAKLLVY